MGDPVTNTSGSASPLPDPRTGPGAPPPTPPPAAPVTVTSEHCLESSIADFRQLGETLAGNPCSPILTQLLPQITDHGTTEIILDAPLNPGTYRGGVRVDGPTWMHARLRMVDGRIEGTIDFFPGLIKAGGILGVGDATLSQLQIHTDPTTNAITFSATATFLNLPIPLIGSSTPMNVTEELTETLFGRRMSSIPGPASGLVQAFFNAQANSASRLENLVDMSAARFRIVANTPGDDVPEIGDVSNAAIHLNELRISPTVTLRNIDLRIEVWPNEETGGFRVVIPRASIGEIVHSPPGMCNGAPNPGSTIRNVRLEDVNLELAPRGDRNALGVDMFNALTQSLGTAAAFCSGQPANFAALANSQALYPMSGSGRIVMESGSIQGGDITLHPLTGDHTISFNLTGQANGDLTATVDAPEIGLDRAALILGGELLHGQTSAVSLENALLRSLHATVNVRSGEMSYNASFTPDLGQAALTQNNPEGNALFSAALLGFTATNPVTVSGTAVGTDRESHTVHVEGGRLNPSNARFFAPLGATGQADFSFGGLGLDATFTRSGMRLDRFVLPEYSLSGEVTRDGDSYGVSIVNGRSTALRLAGLGLVLDHEGPTAGVTHTATVNTRVERLRFTVPSGPMAGTYEMSGTLTGTAGLLDKHTSVPGAFTPPDFRPTLNGMRLALDGSIRRVERSGRRVPVLTGHISIRDNAAGNISISGNSSINMGGEAITARTTIVANLGRQLQTHTFTPPAGGPEGHVRYYDFDPAADMNIPLSQILLEAAVPGVGTLRSVGSGRIGGRITDPNFSVDLPFGTQHLDINRPELPVTGTVDLTGGGVDIRGDRRRITANIRPPETVHMNFTQVVDGTTYTYTGDLTSHSSFRATIDPRTGRARFREMGAAPQLVGDLTVTATAMRDGRRVTLGAGAVHVSTTYALSGTADSSSAHLSLTVPETGLTGEVTSAISLGANTIPVGTRLSIPIRNFSGNIDLNTRTLAFTSRWTAGDISPARVVIPSLSLPGGINFTNVTADLTAVAGGQQWEVNRTAAGAVSFRALAGSDGRLPPFELNLSANDGTGGNLALTVGSSSRADGIGGTFDAATGELVLNVTGMTLGSRIGGTLSLSGNRVDLSGVTTDAGLPALQVRINTTTGDLRLTATTPHPTGVTYPPTDLASWLGWTTDQWRDNYVNPMNATSHLAVMSEATMNLPASATFFPAGRGRVYVDMPDLDLTANLRDPAGLSSLISRVQSALVLRREFPNPPPRATDGEPIVYSEAQTPLYRTTTPGGTLFFVPSVRSDGVARLDPDLSRALSEGLGMTQRDIEQFITRGRMEMDDFIGAIRRDPTVRGAISEADLITLTQSYLNDSGGDFRRFSLRMVTTLGNIRASLGAIGTASAAGVRPIRAHHFADPSYHAPLTPNDGTDMQMMAVLPAAPSAVAGVLTGGATTRWDSWASDGTVAAGVESGSLLGDGNYSVTRTSATEGNITVVRINNAAGSAMAASTRTFRLVPLSGGRTLMIMDQHEDFPGADADLHLPRMSFPTRSSIDITSVGLQVLGAIKPATPSLSAHYANRFALSAQRILELATGTSVSGVAYNSQVPMSRTSREIEFLTLDTTTDAANPALTISPDAFRDDVRSELVRRLGPGTGMSGGATAATIDGWIRDGRIPLQALLTETGLNTSFTLPIFQAMAQVHLSDPAPAPETMRHFTARTERFLMVVEDLRHMAEIRAPAGGGYNARVRVLRDSRFHRTVVAPQDDSIDSYMYWYVPGDLGVAASDITWFVHHADQFHTYDPGSFTASTIATGPDAGRTYVDTTVDGGTRTFTYRMSVPTDPLTVSGDVLLSPWRQEDLPGVTDFYANQGWWLTMPLTGGGFVVVRAGVINTVIGDRDRTIEPIAGAKTVGFMRAVLNAAQTHAGVASRREITYGVGTAVTERNESPFN